MCLGCLLGTVTVMILHGVSGTRILFILLPIRVRHTSPPACLSINLVVDIWIVSNLGLGAIIDKTAMNIHVQALYGDIHSFWGANT